MLQNWARMWGLKHGTSRAVVSYCLPVGRIWCNQILQLFPAVSCTLTVPPCCEPNDHLIAAERLPSRLQLKSRCKAFWGSRLQMRLPKVLLCSNRAAVQFITAWRNGKHCSTASLECKGLWFGDRCARVCDPA